MYDRRDQRIKKGKGGTDEVNRDVERGYTGSRGQNDKKDDMA